MDILDKPNSGMSMCTIILCVVVLLIIIPVVINMVRSCNNKGDSTESFGDDNLTCPQCNGSYVCNKSTGTCAWSDTDNTGRISKEDCERDGRCEQDQSWNCGVSGCEEVSGLGGAYTSLQDCSKNCTEKWKCVGGAAIQDNNASGTTYPSESDAKKKCGWYYCSGPESVVTLCDDNTGAADCNNGNLNYSSSEIADKQCALCTKWRGTPDSAVYAGSDKIIVGSCSEACVDSSERELPGENNWYGTQEQCEQDSAGPVGGYCKEGLQLLGPGAIFSNNCKCVGAGHSYICGPRPAGLVRHSRRERRKTRA